jgi:hypothetical protein
VRIWTKAHVKAGGRYRMEEGHIVVDSIVPIRRADITADLARESGFDSVKALLEIAKHGPGENIYLVRFHYLPPGGWEAARRADDGRGGVGIVATSAIGSPSDPPQQAAPSDRRIAARLPTIDRPRRLKAMSGG